jgi:hypothetical protein
MRHNDSRGRIAVLMGLRGVSIAVCLEPMICPRMPRSCASWS